MYMCMYVAICFCSYVAICFFIFISLIFLFICDVYVYVAIMYM